LKAELERAGIVSKRREGTGGELSGGKRFSRGALYLMLQNWLYRGRVAHKEKIYPGQHEAIIESELWQAVQDRLAAGRRERSMAVGAEAPSLLLGLNACPLSNLSSCGSPQAFAGRERVCGW
jgi:site-specific DNA recombinase